MDAAENDVPGFGPGGGLAGELEGVSAEIREADDLIALVVVSRIQVRWFEWASVPLYALSIVLLLAVLIVGVGHGTAKGTKQWLPLGPVSFQPSQFANLATILLLGRVMGNWREAPTSVFQLWKPVVVVAAPMLLVLAEPDLGVAIIFGAVLIATLYWAGTPLGLMFMLLSPLIALILAFQGWIFSAYMIGLIAFLYFARAAILLTHSFPNALQGLGSSRSAANLRRHGLEADVERCARENDLDVVPRYVRRVGPAAEVAV